MRERWIWAAGIVAAALLGFWFGRDHSPGPPIAVATPTPSRAPTPREERRVPGTGSATLPTEPEVNKSLSPAEEARLTEGRRASENIVANALALGQWSDSDANDLVVASQYLPIAEQHELQLRVARAINEDRLKYATPPESDNR